MLVLFLSVIAAPGFEWEATVQVLPSEQAHVYHSRAKMSLPVPFGRCSFEPLPVLGGARADMIMQTGSIDCEYPMGKKTLKVSSPANTCAEYQGASSAPTDEQRASKYWDGTGTFLFSDGSQDIQITVRCRRGRG